MIHGKPSTAGADSITPIASEIAYTFLNRFDGSLFQLNIPSCFDYAQTQETVIEITTSRNLQPLKLLYRHNVVTGSEVLIFYNSQAYAEHYKATGYDK